MSAMNKYTLYYIRSSSSSSSSSMSSSSSQTSSSALSDASDLCETLGVFDAFGVGGTVVGGLVEGAVGGTLVGGMLSGGTVLAGRVGTFGQIASSLFTCVHRTSYNFPFPHIYSRNGMADIILFYFSFFSV